MNWTGLESETNYGIGNDGGIGNAGEIWNKVGTENDGGIENGYADEANLVCANHFAACLHCETTRNLQ